MIRSHHSSNWNYVMASNFKKTKSKIFKVTRHAQSCLALPSDFMSYISQTHSISFTCLCAFLEYCRCVPTVGPLLTPSLPPNLVPLLLPQWGLLWKLFKGCGKLNSDLSSQDVHILCSLETEYVTLHGNRDLQMWLNYGILRWRDYPGLSEGDQCNHKGHCDREMEG